MAGYQRLSILILAPNLSFNWIDHLIGSITLMDNFWKLSLFTIQAVDWLVKCYCKSNCVSAYNFAGDLNDLVELKQREFD